MNYKALCKYMLKNSYDTLQHRVGHYLKSEGKYPYIPIDDVRLSRIIEDLIKDKVQFNKKSFIDIGCGTSIIPKIFKIIGCKKSVGLEYEELYCKMDKYENYLIQGDLTTFNFKKYDILYTYNPISNPKLMEEGLINIMNTMKKGSVLYYVQAGEISNATLSKFTEVNHTIFKFKK